MATTRDTLARPVEPSLVARVAGGLRYAIFGQAPGDWFGPQQPLTPVTTPEQAATVAGRQFDFRTGLNLDTRPRSGEAINFEQLRALADAYDLLRLVIETRKDQIEKLPWHIKPRADGAEPDARCAAIQAFLERPDREHDWQPWLRMLLEDLFVLDAPALYVRRTRGGEVWGLEPVDGATIKRVVDSTGRTPGPGETAYQQILKGMPAVNYTREELIYAPRNVRTNRVYGYSPVEQVLMTVNIALRRQTSQLGYYTEGNIPEMLATVPETWTGMQIQQFQQWWDSLMVSQPDVKRRILFVPGGVAPQELKQSPLKDLYDEWLARIVCYAFSVEVTPFVSQVNRAVAETVREQTLAEGLAPLKSWVKRLVDRVIREHFLAPDLEFGWQDEDAVSPKERAEIAAIYIAAKVMTPDEARADIGKKPLTPEERDVAFPAPPPMLGAPGEGSQGDPITGGQADDEPPPEDAAAKEAADALGKARRAGGNAGSRHY